MKQLTLPLLVLFMTAASALSAVLYMPTTTPFSPWNTGGSGLSLLLADLKPYITRDLAGVQCSSTLVLILQRPLNAEEAERLKQLVECGSALVLFDSRGFSKTFLENLSIAVDFTGPVLDEIYAYRYRWVLKTAVDISGGLSLTLAIPNATALSALTEPNYIQAYTSKYAYIDLDGNGFYTSGEPMGRFLIVAGWSIGKGSVILIPSTLLPTNEYVVLENNTALLERIAGGKPLYLYIGVLNLTLLDRVKEELYKWSAARPQHVAFTASFILSAVVTTTWFFNNIGRRASRRESAVAVAVASIPYLSTAFTATPLHIAIPAALLLLVLFNPSLVIPLAASATLVSTGLNPIYTPLYVLTVVFTGRFVKLGVGRSFLGRTALSLLTLQALNTIAIIIYPQLIISILLASTATVCLTVLSYTLYLRSVAVKPLMVESEVYVGSKVALGFTVYSVKPVTCIVEYSRGVITKLVKPGEAVVFAEIVEHTGINRVAAHIYATDPHGYAFRDLGVHTFEFNALPMTYRLLERARHLLGRFGAGLQLSEVSLTVLERVEGYGRLITLPGEKLRAHLSEIKRARGSGAHELFARIIEEYVASREAVRSRVGEYVGARVYEPGDSLKTIHWKKSLSKQMLISKDYSTSSEGEGFEHSASSGGRVVAVVNLYASNPMDLDSVLAALLHYIVDSASKDPNMHVDVLLISGPYMAVLRGPAVGILKLLYDALVKKPVEALYSYESINRYMGVEEISFMYRSGGWSLRAIIAALESSAGAVVKALVENGYRPPQPFTIIHTRAASTWASFTAYALSSMGFVYIPFAEVLSSG